MDGVTYLLNATEHLAGRTEGAIMFPDDPLLSPRHANFIYREGRLHVIDEGSVNGVFIRIKAPVILGPGALFLIGEQLLQVEPSPPDLGPQPDAEGTYFYASPKRPSKMKLIQRLRGGEIGMIYRSRSDTISIGREGNDVNFLDDPFISGRHAQIAISPEGQVTLSRSRVEERHVRADQRRDRARPRRPRFRGTAAPARRSNLSRPTTARRLSRPPVTLTLRRRRVSCVRFPGGPFDHL